MRPRCEGQMYAELRPFPRTAAHVDAPAVRVDQPLHDVEPQACARDGVLLEAGALERLEQAPLILLGDTDSVVAHAEQHLIPHAAEPDLYLAHAR